MTVTTRITPFLWFADQAEEAATLYVSLFDNSRITGISRYDDASAAAGGRPAGSAMTVNFELDGQPFVALNGGPLYTFTEAISFVVSCESQAEVDHFWNALTAGGDPSAQQCGWLKDRYGVSWQVVPTALYRLLSDPDPERARRATQAMLKMKKLSVEELERAAAGAVARSD